MDEPIAHAPMPTLMPAASAPSLPDSAEIIGRTAVGYRRAAEQHIAIWPMVIAIYATLLPREVALHFGNNYVFGDRIVLLLTLPWVMRYLWQGTIRFVLPDWLVLFSGIWKFIALWQVHGLDKALVSGLSFGFDGVAGYYLARVSFRSLDDMRRVFIVCAPGFLLAGFGLVAESISNEFLVRPLFAAIFGKITYITGTENVNDVLQKMIRLGLMRAYGSWVHPIEAGLHLATLVPIYIMSGVRGWPKWVGIMAAFCAVFTLSSAALLILVAMYGAIAYNWLTRHVRELTWPLAFLALGAVLMVMSVSSNSGLLGLLIRFATLDPTSSYYRIAEWQYGSLSVINHPWFGVGFNGYDRPSWMVSSSIDTQWLLFAMRYGLPDAVADLLAALSAMGALLAASSLANARDRLFYRGILMCLIAFVLAGFTVSLQGGTQTWYTMLLGGCVACAQHTYVIDWAFWIRRAPRPA